MFLSQVLLLFSNGLQMAITLIFQGSYIDLKIVKTSHFGAKVTNINIWTPLSFSDNSFYFFLHDLQMAYTMVFWRCQRILKPLHKLKLVISVLR